MLKKIIFLLPLLIISCVKNLESTNKYLDYSSKDDKLSGGVKMIEIKTPSGKFSVWTKRVGNNPKKKVLLLHGGPGANHEYFQAIDSFFPKESIEYYYYDQLHMLSVKVTY